MASQIRQRATLLCRGFYNSRCFTSLREITSSSMSSEAQAQTCCRNAESGLYGLERFSRREFGQEGTKAPRKMYEYLHVRKKAGFVEKNPCITFVLGGPGSGKGTQCAKIVEMFGFAHLSAGDLLRREIINDSENGTMIRKMITEGKIVPSEVTVKLIQRAMESNGNDKFLIDGFPRSDENRVAFEHIIGAEPDIVLFLDCPEEDMVKRVLSRNQGRIDDNIETIRLRLKVFAELNLPVINYYSEKGKVHKINAVGTVEEVFERIQPHFDAYTVFK